MLVSTTKKIKKGSRKKSKNGSNTSRIGMDQEWITVERSGSGSGGDVNQE
jgi:hypothetical protein